MAKAPPPPGDDAAPPTGRKRAAKAPERLYERPRGGEARAIADLMPHVGRAAFRKFGFVQSSIVSRWAEIAGDRYAAVSQPDMIRFPAGQKSGGTLHLTVSGAHAPMLQHVEPDLIARINRFFGYAAVARIRMTQGVVTPPARSRGTAPAAVVKAVPAELGDSLRDIGDPELRTVLENLAAALGTASNLPKIG